jgi:hypothetical protein
MSEGNCDPECVIIQKCSKGGTGKSIQPRTIFFDIEPVKLFIVSNGSEGGEAK